MADRSSILPRRDEPLFPIAERNTPILDRINERRKGNNTLAHKLGTRTAKLINADEDEKKEVLAKSREDFRESLANELGVPQDAIKDEFVESATQVFGLVTEEDAVNEDVLEVLSEGGILGDDGEEEDSESEDDESGFSSE